METGRGGCGGHEKGGRMRSANHTRRLLRKAIECGAIYRGAKRRLRVRSASAFGNSRRISQVAALLVDVVYGKSSFAIIPSSLGLL
jgi:hypothetical protein